MTEEYKKTEQFLQSSGKFRIELGLGRMSKIMSLLGNPQDKIKIIHVAGTNGKGSVCTLIAEVLKTANYKTALYTSPHLIKYNERFKINGDDISDEDFAKYVFEIERLATENSIDLSEFEILTAVAYKYFYDQRVDFAVMETGLGGRFDAVNVIKTPFMTAITSISIDHKDRLGDCVEKIAYEKAGIIKKNVEIVVNNDNAGLNIIDKISREIGAKLIISDKKVDILYENDVNYAKIDGKMFEFSLWGLHQKQNLSLVLKMIDILNAKGMKINENHIESSLKTAFIPARFQYNKDKKLLIDGAHNVGAAEILRKNLDFYFPNQQFSWVYGTLSTKEYDKIVNILFKDKDEVHFVKFSNSLSVEPDVISQKMNNNVAFACMTSSKTENILKFSSSNSSRIITGSFYMIGELVNKLLV
jgi:dihydrofolate synthase/folylpolyglutamate synthase